MTAISPSADKKAAVAKFAKDLEIEGRSLWADARDRFFRNRAAVISLIILAFIGILVVVGPWLSPHEFDAIDWGYMAAPPETEMSHWFGTDSLGRDLFVRTLMGGRISFMVGILGALTAVVIGTLYGATAGYAGGRVDSAMMRVLEILQSFPFMFLVILLMTMFGRSIYLIFLCIGGVSWLDMARIVRGQTISLKGREFIEAARVCGTKPSAIIVRHIVPNVLGIVVVYASLLVPSMILFESFLSFLGLGVQEPMTSWGALVNEGAQSMEVATWQLAFPVFFLVVTLFCFNYVGDGLRDALDPKDR
ncbi:oligopeptide ABC transporter permease OppC [Sansalvadorimonas sp. 2012CJ34-2]|uniref:Oligopeptide transport system permease protein OppC n=1 Tax=Parendozoicomonas callyspongiae TaxID=2942213 RepID=A0ABT0PHN9_9GAMM|nr:oligopeptide ABC transporter permease OppC [Sansalvadorimonas sp. 2012CJ34-2]MCL6270902.1 oligopeptide ABC transporter permease OppC [Sansalvadorimonas sp. 2012CJ34-2]